MRIALYRMYFEEEMHPSSKETLTKACLETGLGEEEARKVADDEEDGVVETKALMREQISNGIDSVPFVVIEGKKRDITLEGAKEVDEYTKALEQIIKESV
jgi:predicted DsbA family dithiol-disulfide isomerase